MLLPCCEPQISRRGHHGRKSFRSSRWRQRHWALTDDRISLIARASLAPMYDIVVRAGIGHSQSPGGEEIPRRRFCRRFSECRSVTIIKALIEAGRHIWREPRSVRCGRTGYLYVHGELLSLFSLLPTFFSQFFTDMRRKSILEYKHPAKLRADTPVYPKPRPPPPRSTDPPTSMPAWARRRHGRGVGRLVRVAPQLGHHKTFSLPIPAKNVANRRLVIRQTHGSPIQSICLCRREGA